MSQSSSENARVIVLHPSAIVAAVVLAVLTIGLVLEPGGGPTVAQAVEPEPLPELTGGRAAPMAGRGLPSVPAPVDGASFDRAARVQRELGRTAPGAGLAAPIDQSEHGRATTPDVSTAPVTPADPPTRISRRVPPSNPGMGARGAGGIDGAAAGSLAFDEPVIELGQVAFNAALEREVTFRNRGNAPITILGVRTTCGCTAADPTVERLAPGESGSVRITFMGKNEGQQAQFVRLITDDPEQPVYAVRVRAAVTPQDVGGA